MERIKDLLDKIKKFYNDNKRFTISLTAVIVLLLVSIPVLNMMNSDDGETDPVFSPTNIDYEKDVVDTDGEINNLHFMSDFMDKVDHNEPTILRLVNQTGDDTSVVTLDYDGEFIEAKRNEKCSNEDLDHNGICRFERITWKKEDGLLNYYLVSGDTQEPILSVDLSINTNKDYYNSLYTVNEEQDVIISDNGRSVENLELLTGFLRNTLKDDEQHLNIVTINDLGIIEVTSLHYDGNTTFVNNHKTSDDSKNCNIVAQYGANSCSFNKNMSYKTNNTLVYTVSNGNYSETLLVIDLDEQNRSQDVVSE